VARFNLAHPVCGLLQRLDLSYCQLGRIPWTLFSGLWSLQTLDVRGNQLRYLASHTFSELISLQSLLLADNSLTSVDDVNLKVSLDSDRFSCLHHPCSNICLVSHSITLAGRDREDIVVDLLQTGRKPAANVVFVVTCVTCRDRSICDQLSTDKMPPTGRRYGRKLSTRFTTAAASLMEYGINQSCLSAFLSCVQLFRLGLQLTRP